jgi:hypothetical protein
LFSWTFKRNRSLKPFRQQLLGVAQYSYCCISSYCRFSLNSSHPCGYFDRQYWSVWNSWVMPEVWVSKLGIPLLNFHLVVPLSSLKWLNSFVSEGGCLFSTMAPPHALHLTGVRKRIVLLALARNCGGFPKLLSPQSGRSGVAAPLVAGGCALGPFPLFPKGVWYQVWWRAGTH